MRTEGGDVGKGAYVLFFEVPGEVEIEVGLKRKKRWTLSGTYAYVGSAMKSLEKRVERHLRKDKRKRWHIDYAMEHAIPIAVLLIETELRIEEQLSALLARHFRIVPGFGASDLKTKSNLFAVGSLEELVRLISNEFPDVKIFEYRIR